MIVEYRDGELAVDEPIKNFHGAALKGCDECADFLGRGADLSVGSVGSMDGWSSVLVRTERGRRALDNARGRLDFREIDNPEALVKLDTMDKRIAVRHPPSNVRSGGAPVHRLRGAPGYVQWHRPGARGAPALSGDRDARRRPPPRSRRCALTGTWIESVA